jgi:hypothetical protein
MRTVRRPQHLPGERTARRPAAAPRCSQGRLHLQQAADQAPISARPSTLCKRPPRPLGRSDVPQRPHCGYAPVYLRPAIPVDCGAGSAPSRVRRSLGQSRCFLRRCPLRQRSATGPLPFWPGLPAQSGRSLLGLPVPAARPLPVRRGCVLGGSPGLREGLLLRRGLGRPRRLWCNREGSLLTRPLSWRWRMGTCWRRARTWRSRSSRSREETRGARGEHNAGSRCPNVWGR